MSQGLLLKFRVHVLWNEKNNIISAEKKLMNTNF